MPDIDPAKEWRRLAEIYAQKYDSELLKLYEEIEDLTPTAQEALKAEISTRRLEIPSSKMQDNPELSVGAEALIQDEDISSGVTIWQGESREQAEAASQLLKQARIENWIE